MTRIGTLAALAACLLLASCKGMKIRTDSGGPAVEVETQAPPAPDAGAAAGASGAEDRHWIRADEVFMARHDAYTKDCFEVTPARVLEAPTEASKGQAKLWEYLSGSERWSEHYWKSRPAERADLRLGVKVIFFKGGMDGGRSHGAPKRREEARPGGDAWFCSTVSDDSDLFKGEVKVVGYDYGAKVETLRVIVE